MVFLWDNITPLKLNPFNLGNKKIGCGHTAWKPKICLLETYKCIESNEKFENGIWKLWKFEDSGYLFWTSASGLSLWCQCLKKT
jgi:hypothetical protein